MGGPALQKAVLGSVSRSETGTASGVFNTFRQLGGAVGTAIAVIILYTFGDMATTTSFGEIGQSPCRLKPDTNPDEAGRSERMHYDGEVTAGLGAGEIRRQGPALQNSDGMRREFWADPA